MSKKDYSELLKPMENDPSWLQKALKEFGQKEIKGKKDNPKINEYLKSTSYEKSQIKDEVPWCSAFANWCMKKSNYEGTHSASARSWEKWGKKITKPTRGCIVVFQRGNKDSWQGHVGFYMSETNNYIEVLGGNQGDEVSISKYSKDRLIGFRALETSLKKGSKWGAVTQLQKLLHKAGEDIGKAGADGDFGMTTTKAVKSYQKKMGFTQTGKVKVEYKGKKVVFIFGEKDGSAAIDKEQNKTTDANLPRPKSTSGTSKTNNQKSITNRPPRPKSTSTTSKTNNQNPITNRPPRPKSTSTTSKTNNQNPITKRPPRPK